MTNTEIQQLLEEARALYLDCSIEEGVEMANRKLSALRSLTKR
jgi:hypothetical protein